MKPIVGRCACGKITFTARAEPMAYFLCHCTDCQKAVGGPYAANVWFFSKDIEFEDEPEALRCISDKGTHTLHQFCSTCGSPVGMQIEEMDSVRGVRAATLADADRFLPDAAIYMKNAYAWEDFGGVPQFDEDVTDEFGRQLVAKRLRDT